MSKLFGKKFLIISFVIFIVIVSFFIYSYVKKEKQEQRTQILLGRITEAVNLMESAKTEMPQELLEVHEFLVKQIQTNEFKLYQIPPELKGKLIMYHGVKTKGIYVDPSIDLRAEIWIPIFYHEAGHLYWHSQYPVETFEEFQEQLYASEGHSYIVGAQAWNVIKEHFPAIKENLNSQELKLFTLYEKETKLYNKMIEGDLTAKTDWNKIIEENIRVQREQQEFLQ